MKEYKNAGALVALYESALQKKDKKIEKLRKEIRILKKKIEKQNIDLMQMRSVFNGNVELQNININLERENEILKRKLAGETIEGEQGEEEWL